MHGETAFRSQISKIRRRHVIRILHEILLNASLLYLSFNILFCGLEMAGIVSRMSDRWWHAACGGFSLLLGGVISLSAKPAFPRVLIEIDRRLELRDRLSTAYEYFRHHPDNRFTGLLVRDAADLLPSFKIRQGMPMALSRRHWAAGALLLLNIFWYSQARDIIGDHWTGREIRNIEKAGQMLKDYSLRRIDKTKSPSPVPNTEAGQRLEQIRRSLQDRNKTYEEQVQSMHQYREEVRAERASLTKELGDKLEAAEINTLAAPKLAPSEKLSSGQLEELQRFLNETFENHIPDAVNRDIEGLHELYRIEDLLSRILNNFKEDRAMAGISRDAGGSQSQEKQPAESDRSQRDNRSEKKADRSHSNRNSTGAGQYGSPDSRNPGLDDGLPGEDPDPAGAYSATAGKATSNAEKASENDLQGPGGALTRETIASGPAKSYRIQIRALTNMGKAHLSEAEIFKSYRREVEKVLQKEDIPPNYRKYIQNYFHSIGIKTEKETYETR